MAVTDRNRRDLYTELEHQLGAEPANTLMQLLPVHPADELLTTTYFHAEMGIQRAELVTKMSELRSDMRGEMNELRIEIKGEMSELRTEIKGEMGELRGEIRGEMTELRIEMRSEMSALRNEVVDRITRAETRMVRWFVGSAAANLVTVITAVSI